MAERPILFSAPMVLALIAGRKTMTRRVLTEFESLDDVPSEIQEDQELRGWHLFGDDFWCKPPCWIGDLLWVREGWRVWSQYDDVAPGRIPSNVDVQYAADAPLSPWDSKARPSIHMPRWASRLTLEVTDVKVERVQDISSADTMAEGVECATCAAMRKSACNNLGCFASREAFRKLWDDLNGAGSWEVNPYVAAISFIVHHANIDALPRKEAA